MIRMNRARSGAQVLTSITAVVLVIGVVLIAHGRTLLAACYYYSRSGISCGLNGMVITGIVMLSLGAVLSVMTCYAWARAARFRSIQPQMVFATPAYQVLPGQQQQQQTFMAPQQQYQQQQQPYPQQHKTQQQPYPQQQYPQQPYPQQQGYPQQAYPQQAYPQQAYTQQGYQPQQGYQAPQSGYQQVQPGYGSTVPQVQQASVPALDATTTTTSA